MNRRTFGVVLVAAALSIRTAALGAQVPLVIRRAEIERSGWNRIAELLEGAVGWGRSSVDGFTYSASPDRLPQPGQSAAGTPQWIVFVDDQPVQSNMFGLHLLELLPVSPGEIDSVMFVRGPAFVNGTPAPRGAVRIFTKRPLRGRFGELAYEHGDETGDPGPYRYTTLHSPNLEKLGPFAYAGAGFAAPRWMLHAGAHFASLNTTDSIILARVAPFGGQVPQDEMTASPVLRAEVDAFGHHELLASWGEQRGLLLVPTTTRQQSMASEATSVGIAGTLDSLRGAVIDYGGAFWSADAREIDSPLPFIAGHRREARTASLAARRWIGSTVITAGAAGYDWRLHRNGGTRTRSAAREYVALRLPAGSLTFDATGGLVNGSRGTTADGEGSMTLTLDSSTSIVIGAATIHEHPDVDGTWIDAAVLGREPRAERTRLSRGALAVVHSAGGRVAFSADGRLERVTNWRVAGRPALPLSSLLDSASLVTGSGTLAGGRFRVESQGGTGLQGSLEYDRTQLVSGDESLRKSVDSSPADELRAELSSVPARDLRITATANLLSGTKWPGFGVDSETTQVPAITRIDASLEKWMWRRRLRIELLFRNVLNKPERYHPYGAQWNLRWHLLASVVLPPYARP
ncbi:MAG TPA: hypothetical protein VLN49_11735 [Gemmatimonadaceae bacterium]|nr:hypothetical protein [Gemmatimonadaceae bacterium]